MSEEIPWIDTVVARTAVSRNGMKGARELVYMLCDALDACTANAAQLADRLANAEADLAVERFVAEVYRQG